MSTQNQTRKLHYINQRYISRSDTYILSTFVVLNLILSLPNVIFSLNQEALISILNQSFFQINLEVSSALTLWAWLSKGWSKRKRTWFWLVFLLGFYFALIYFSYASTLENIYQLTPNFANDFTFILKGLPFFLAASDFPVGSYLVFGFGVFGILILLGWGTRAVLVNRIWDGVGWITRFLLSFLCLGTLIIFWQTSGTSPRINTLSVAVFENIQRSQASREDVENLMLVNPFQTYDYAQYTLTEKPNIYLIFIESYGSVLFTQSHFQDRYFKILTDLDRQITTQGWEAVSAVSSAPTWGGGSWISYTNALFGVNISEQRQYEAIKEAYQQIPYPNLGRYLQTQGYAYYWVTPIQLPLEPVRSQADQNFYGADHWITFDTLEYDGPVYGWGPAPPDQYTFGFINQLAQTNNQPDFVVYLTQNSHYPYRSLPPIFDDWKKFESLPSLTDQPPTTEERAFRQTRKDYVAAIEYTFAVLAQFITDLSDPNTIIILMGDHQPPGVSYKGDGFTVPIHIISQDMDFLKNFVAYGFGEGLLLEITDPAIKHAGFYSLFVRNLIVSYGVEQQKLPSYFPNGLGQ